MTRPLRRPLAALVAGLLALCLSAGAAQAKNRQTLDTSDASPGEVIQDAAGNAYIAWVHSGSDGAPDAPAYCKVARGGTCTRSLLPIPLTGGETSLSSVDGVAGAFPVFGGGSTVYVVAPRYVQDDVLLYTSTDGGQSFGSPTRIPSSLTPGAGPYSNKSNPTNVFRSGGSFMIAANNAGLGFSTFEATEGNFSFSSLPPGSVEGSTMGLDGAANPVLAAWNLPSPGTVYYYRYGGSGNIDDESNWIGPTVVAHGDEPRIASGASGLLLASEDYATPSSADPTVVNVRKYNSGIFGAPVRVETDPSTPLFDAGAINQSPAGHVALAWPGDRSGDKAFVMKLFRSSSGGAAFGGAGDVARIGDGYAVEDNAQLAVGDDGQGWLTFRDNGGLELADLVLIPPPPYSGPTTTSTTPAGPGASLTIKGPKACVQSGQPFKVAVGAKAKKKLAHGHHVKLLKVVFRLDGKRVGTVKHKPFELLITALAGASKSKHTVKAKVKYRLSGAGHRPRSKRLNFTVAIC